jgi:hypothetical protein
MENHKKTVSKSNSFQQFVYRVILSPVSIIISLIIFICFHAFFDLSLTNHVAADTSGYTNPAIAISQGDGFSIGSEDDHFVPYFTRTPIYPLFLSFFYFLSEKYADVLSVWTVRILFFFTVIFLLPIPKKNRSIYPVFFAQMGRFILLFCPQSMCNFSFMLSDGLFVILIFMALFMACRALETKATLDFASAGILFGIATLTRPVGLLLPFALLMAIILRDVAIFKRIRSRDIILKFILILLPVYILFPGGWVTRNYTFSGHAKFSPLLGYNLALHNLQTINDMLNNNAFINEPIKNKFAHALADSRNVGIALSEIKNEFNIDEFEADNIALSTAKDAITTYPLKYITRSIFYSLQIYIAPADALDMMIHIFNREDISIKNSFQQGKVVDFSLHIFFRLFNFCFFIIIPLGIFLKTSSKDRQSLTLWIYVTNLIYFTAVTSATIPSHGRFLLPIYPTILFLYFLFCFNSQKK